MFKLNATLFQLGLGDSSWWFSLRWSPPEISPQRFPSDLESLLQQMKGLVFAKPVTSRWLQSLMTTLTIILTLQDPHDT